MIQRLHRYIREAVVDACEQSSLTALSGVAHDGPGDTIYEIDRVSEATLVRFMRQEAAAVGGLVLIAEGLPTGQVVLPEHIKDDEARWRIIMDPIDGTRGLMYQKRSAWILTGVADNRGPRSTLRDIFMAVQTEIPLLKQYLCDELWAIRGEGVEARRFNRLTGDAEVFTPTPSDSTTIAHGFVSFVRYFSGIKQEIAAIDEEVVQAVLGPVPADKALCFEDQYISSAGQLYELMVGHDRFVADLRPVLDPLLVQQGRSPRPSSHPYDLCTELIAREAGVIVTDPWGRPLTAPLDVSSRVGWVGCANQQLWQQLNPPLQTVLHRRGLVPG
jgi:fructose-1,6-bisphosphatase/inositol monophosphatase family enzyme